MTHVDGSVRFYSDDINAGNPSADNTSANWKGPSKYGVIGALGSMNGGD